MFQLRLPRIPDAEIAAFIDANEWRFAKTMPQWPHWYIVKDQCSDPEFFERFVRHIRRYGYIEHFYRKKMQRFAFGPYKYWSMGAPVHETTIINRADLKDLAGLDLSKLKETHPMKNLTNILDPD